MTKVLVEGKEVKVGDMIGFKSDIEQYGIIVQINERDRWSTPEIIVKPAGEHFEGEYLRGNVKTTILYADDCWLA